MKTNSLKLLITVAPMVDRPQPMTLASLKEIFFADLKPSGFRSLLYLAQRRGWLDLRTLAGQRVAIGTHKAQLALKERLPALLPIWEGWQGHWLCLVFGLPPKTDRQFRYLRLWCRSHYCLRLSRGIYFAPDVYLSHYLAELTPVYQRAFYVLEAKEWRGDKIDRLAREQYGVVELANQYSGISRQIDELLKKKAVQKNLASGQINQLIGLFERLFLALKTDLGIVRYYFPHLKSPLELVATFQSLVEHENGFLND